VLSPNGPNSRALYLLTISRIEGFVSEDAGWCFQRVGQSRASLICTEQPPDGDSGAWRRELANASCDTINTRPIHSRLPGSVGISLALLQTGSLTVACFCQRRGAESCLCPRRSAESLNASGWTYFQRCLCECLPFTFLRIHCTVVALLRGVRPSLETVYHDNMSDLDKTASALAKQMPGSPSDHNGYAADVERFSTESGAIKTAKDGRTILIPQPSDDHNDPLNWSSWKKHAVLLTISFVSFLPDFGTAFGSVTQIPQAKYWHIPVPTIQESVAINTMLSGVSGLAVVMLSNYFGRAPVFFWMKLIACAGCIWYAKAQTFDSFYSARILVGFFVGAGQSVSRNHPMMDSETVRGIPDIAIGRLDVDQGHLL
jgi:hypothetical protein